MIPISSGRRGRSARIAHGGMKYSSMRSFRLAEMLTVASVTTSRLAGGVVMGSKVGVDGVPVLSRAGLLVSDPE